MVQLTLGTALPCISTDTSSQCAIRWARGQLDLCLSSHKCCSRGQTYLPRRLIDISPMIAGKQPRLKDTGHTVLDEEQPNYVCLSHCWGKMPIVRTMKESIKQHQEAIPCSTLSKTFRDSIDIALKFSIRYIWIDSLCIVQDDSLDWQEQGSQMAAIYENCLFVIAATASTDGRGGCFREIPAEYAKPFEAESSNAQGERFATSARKSIQHPDPLIQAYDGYKIGAPLIDRAWVFQENILGLRILHFTATELVWECNGVLACECGSIKSDRYSRKSQPISSQSIENDVSPFKEWYKTVEAYSTRALTYESDKLPALSGIAQRTQRLFSSPLPNISNRYLAGLWERDLLNGLTWRSFPESRSQVLEQCGIPSWSWASVQRPVSRNGEHEIDPDQPTARISHVTCTPTGVDPTGDVLDGELVMVGPLIEVTLEYDPEQNPDPIEISYYVTNKACNDNRVIIYPDHLFSEPGSLHILAGETIFCLWLGSTRMQRSTTSSCMERKLPREFFQTLLLRPSLARPGAFQRIGYFDSSEAHSGEGWFDNVRDQSCSCIKEP